MNWQPPTSTPFPYTTLFRSIVPIHQEQKDEALGELRCRDAGQHLDVGELVGDGLCASEEADAEASRKGLRKTARIDRKSTRLNSSHVEISYAVFCLKKKTSV